MPSGAGEGFLAGEDAVVQPVEELPATARDDGVLRDVGVEVYEAGEDGGSFVVEPADGLGAGLFAYVLIVADFEDFGPFKHDGTIAPCAQFSVFRRVNYAASDACERGVGRHAGRKVAGEAVASTESLLGSAGVHFHAEELPAGCARCADGDGGCDGAGAAF